MHLINLLVLYISVLLFALCPHAETVVINVGGNTTSNPGGVFQPQTVRAAQWDVILFNFTQGNHTATQSTFGAPCVPAHLTNTSINSFDSSFRDAGNFSAMTDLSYVITNPNETVWFFDWNLCGLGGVGGININDRGNETLAGFVRNARRLNGTHSSSSANASKSSTSGLTTPSATHASSGVVATANSALILGFFLAGFALVTAASL